MKARMPDSIPTSWFGADTILQGGRSKDHRTIANNTYLERVDYAGDRDIALRLHGTRVVTYHADGSLTLRANDWHTITTATRINAALPGPWRVGGHRVKGASSWWLFSGGYPILPFGDGLTVHDNGDVSMDGEVIMSADDIMAERARQDDISEKRSESRAAMLIRQHAKGASGAFGTYTPYLWQTREYGATVVKHHPTWNGSVYGCADCVAQS